MDQIRKFCNYLHPLHIPTLFKPPSDFPLIQFLAIYKVFISYRISTLLIRSSGRHRNNYSNKIERQYKDLS